MCLCSTNDRPDVIVYTTVLLDLLGTDSAGRCPSKYADHAVFTGSLSIPEATHLLTIVTAPITILQILTRIGNRTLAREFTTEKQSLTALRVCTRSLPRVPGRIAFEPKGRERAVKASEQRESVGLETAGDKCVPRYRGNHQMRRRHFTDRAPNRQEHFKRFCRRSKQLTA